MKWSKKNRRTVILAGCLTLALLCGLWSFTHQDRLPAGAGAAPVEAEPPSETVPELSLEETYLPGGGTEQPSGAVAQPVQDPDEPLSQSAEDPEAPELVVGAEPGGAEDGRTMAEETALEAALRHAGVTEAELSASSVSPRSGTGYEVAFETGGTAYRYTIGGDGETVLSWSCYGDPPEGQEREDHGSEHHRSVKDRDVGERSAKAAALSQVGLREAEVRWLRAKREETEEGRSYLVTFEYGGADYSYRIDAATGAVLDGGVVG